jgi:hypothetical protein
MRPVYGLLEGKILQMVQDWCKIWEKYGIANGNRTRISALKGPRAA